MKYKKALKSIRKKFGNTAIPDGAIIVTKKEWDAIEKRIELTASYPDYISVPASAWHNLVQTEHQHEQLVGKIDKLQQASYLINGWYESDANGTESDARDWLHYMRKWADNLTWEEEKPFPEHLPGYVKKTKLDLVATSFKAQEEDRDNIIRSLREQLRTAYLHQSENEDEPIWYWQGDGDDHVASMVNGLVVVLRADELREYVASCGGTVPPSEMD